LIALFGPEIVVLSAFQQWLAAKTLLKKLNKIAVEKEDESSLSEVSALLHHAQPIST
jgi:hypothetical protein